jgi:hypothetical protein
MKPSTVALPQAGMPDSAISDDGHIPGRSGGVVDAPGKKHRKAPPSDPQASVVNSQGAKLRAATPMVKTTRLRGRG